MGQLPSHHRVAPHKRGVDSASTCLCPLCCTQQREGAEDHSSIPPPLFCVHVAQTGCVLKHLAQPQRLLLLHCQRARAQVCRCELYCKPTHSSSRPLLPMTCREHTAACKSRAPSEVADGCAARTHAHSLAVTCCCSRPCAHTDCAAEVDDGPRTHIRRPPTLLLFNMRMGEVSMKHPPDTCCCSRCRHCC